MSLGTVTTLSCTFLGKQSAKKSNKNKVSSIKPPPERSMFPIAAQFIKQA